MWPPPPPRPGAKVKSVNQVWNMLEVISPQFLLKIAELALVIHFILLGYTIDWRGYHFNNILLFMHINGHLNLLCETIHNYTVYKYMHCLKGWWFLILGPFFRGSWKYNSFPVYKKKESQNPLFNTQLLSKIQKTICALPVQLWTPDKVSVRQAKTLKCFATK